MMGNITLFLLLLSSMYESLQVVVNVYMYINHSFFFNFYIRTHLDYRANGLLNVTLMLVRSSVSP